MRTPHIRRLVTALAVTTAATLTAGSVGTAFANPSATGTSSVATATSVVDAARAAAFAHGSATGVSKDDTLTATDTLIDPDGKQHVRFVRAHKGLPVLGGDLVVHLDAKSTYLDVTRALHHEVAAETTTPELSAGQARAKAASAAKGDAGSAKLVLDVRGRRATLAYQITVKDSETTEAHGSRTVVIDAATGAVLSNIPTADEFVSPSLKATLRQRGAKAFLKGPSAAAPGPAAHAASPAGPLVSAGASGVPAVGTGASLFVGQVQLNTLNLGNGSYLLQDSTRGNTETRDAQNQEASRFSDTKAFTSTTNNWGNGSVTSRQSAAVDAQYGVVSTLDFYKNVLGRNGIRGDGSGARAMVHFGSNVGNAYWNGDCGCMLYGDGDGQTFTKPLVVLDVTGHELSHGVVHATADLRPTRVDAQGRQFGEPGALNESLADIFGSNVEFQTNNPNNPPNYLIGEKLGLAQTFLRRLDKPSLDKLEGTVDYWSAASYDTEVHAGSGVSSHAYYLLAEGSGKKTIGTVTYNSPTYDGSAVTGIGRDKATQIFYRALSRYMVSTTDFHDARTATLSAAADLYGATSAEYQTVDKAWAAVNVTASNTPSQQH
ncbi:flagellar biosynthesis protein FlgM [Streptomyces sp. ERV7]|uniref:M4 family metallopeptidase n=1 Tax=Streptomyces sp. ERV7 TaxID=1322334 RepID=UPI0007F38E2F|nr:M4 family metallopeptidase [Streptomyces sp. ERV7]OAR23732.1 flagellar biosynthesis protein FlgM [Streptomyces sp. ERV7]